MLPWRLWSLRRKRLETSLAMVTDGSNASRNAMWVEDLRSQSLTLLTRFSLPIFSVSISLSITPQPLHYSPPLVPPSLL